MITFRKKEEMTDYNVYWKNDVNLDNMMEDLEKISEILLRNDGFKKGNRIVCVRNWTIDDTKWKGAELYISKEKMKQIEEIWRMNGFKAIHFVTEKVLV